MNLPELNECKIAVVGLGYVGLPLAIQISKIDICLKTSKKISREIIGFDISNSRINELKKKYDRTNEILEIDLKLLEKIKLTNKFEDLIPADIFIITVPTPINISKKPDLNPLIRASKEVALALKERTKISDKKSAPIIIYESTVYPGATEEVCVPIIEKISNMKFNGNKEKKSFFVGYSPERINPGDKTHKIKDIVKVTSGSTIESANWINNFYSSFINAGTHLAPSIKVAESAKVIENTQRDINIALVNEFSIIFRKLEIDIFDVLDAAKTKWNFLPFSPGLVGGHCIGVDPYYLTFKAKEIGYEPAIVLAGRKINDDRAEWIASQIINEIDKRKIYKKGLKVLIMGFSFKPNCPDIRNTKVKDLNDILSKYGFDITIVDPWINIEEAKSLANIKIVSNFPINKKFKVIIAAVDHYQFSSLTCSELESYLEEEYILFDLKDMIPRDLNPIRL